jgi:hypothetical protein
MSANPAPLWRRSRDRNNELERVRRTFGWSAPRLTQIALVELDRIYVPAWALEKAIRGLTVTPSSVWLRRIAANKLAALDIEAGGTPKLTVSAYRRCQMCDRALLGPEAEARLILDMRFEGEGKRTPCGPGCVELVHALGKREV